MPEGREPLWRSKANIFLSGTYRPDGDKCLYWRSPKTQAVPGTSMKTKMLLLFVPMICAAFAASGAAPAGKFDLEKTKTVMTALIQQKLKEKGVPSMSIALVRDENIVWKAAFGYANVRMKTPATT